MQLHFVSREDYRQKENLKKLYPTAYWINEGGHGKEGVEGAALILQQVPQLLQYTHIICAVGTGTTLAGIITAALQHQTIIGISALKGIFCFRRRCKEIIAISISSAIYYIK